MKKATKTKVKARTQSRKKASKKISPRKRKPEVKAQAPVRKPKPEIKPAFRPHPDKLDVIRQTFVTTLWKFEALPPEQIRNLVREQIETELAEEFSQYFDHVYRMLTRHRLLEEVPDRIPVHIRLAQRLDD